MQSKATSVAAYVSSLTAERRAAIEAVRKVIKANLDKDIQEGMGYGMIGYAIGHDVFPSGYHCDPKLPLPVGALASQKNYLSFYWMTLYSSGPDEAWFRARWAKTGKKLDMGKCCVRFKRLEDLPLELIGELVKRTKAKAYIERYERTRGAAAQEKPAAPKRAAKRTTQRNPPKPGARR